MLSLLGRAVVGFFALLGLIMAVDLATAGSGEGIKGGTPLFDADESPTMFLDGRDVRFPSFLEQGTHRAAVLDEDYYFCDARRNILIRIPRGFITDFASIPDVGRILIDRFGLSLEPAGVHDWLYAAHPGVEATDQNRRLADDIFLDALADNGVGLASRLIMYAAVRLFGAGPYSEVKDWNDRFLNPATNQPYAPPLSPAEVGIVATGVDCSKFDDPEASPVVEFVGCYSTDIDLQFTEDRREECQPGDGLTIPRF